MVVYLPGDMADITTDAAGAISEDVGQTVGEAGVVGTSEVAEGLDTVTEETGAQGLAEDATETADSVSEGAVGDVGETVTEGAGEVTGSAMEGTEDVVQLWRREHRRRRERRAEPDGR